MARIITTTLRMPETLHAAITQSADHYGHTMNALILQILWDWSKTHATSDSSTREITKT